MKKRGEDVNYKLSGLKPRIDGDNYFGGASKIQIHNLPSRCYNKEALPPITGIEVQRNRIRPKLTSRRMMNGIMDMTNIDFKIPSEHTVCGKRFDAEMQ